MAFTAIRSGLPFSKLSLLSISIRCVATEAVTADAIGNFSWENARPYEEIPGPKTLPIIGNLHQFIPGIGELGNPNLKDQHKKLMDKYGKIVKVSKIPGRRDILFLFDPKFFEEVYRGEGLFPDRDIMQSLAYYRNVCRKDYFQGVGGLLVTYGEEWKKFRTAVNPPMMQPRIANMYVKPIMEVTNDFIERIKGLRDSKSEMPEDFIDELKKWSLESIAMVALDKRLGCLEPDLKPDSEPQKMIRATQDFISSSEILEMRLPLWKIISTPAWRKFERAMDYITEVCSRYINDAIKRMQEKKPGTYYEPSTLERILLRDPDPKTACVMALDMMIAGVDSTAINASNVIYLLSKNQDKQEHLYQELKRFLPNRNDKITAEMIEDMKYLRGCTKESLRLYAVSPFNLRGTTKETVIGNYRIPKDVNIMMGHMVCGLMEEYYPKASRFIPERWLKYRPGDEPHSVGSAEDFDNIIKFKTNPFVYMPFGFGTRMCIGKRFAEMETAVLIIKMIRNFKVEFNYSDLKYTSKLIHKPVSPLKYKLTERCD